MSKSSFILLFLFFGIPLFAQNNLELYRNSPDSLLNVYKKNNQPDSLVLLAREASIWFNKKKKYPKAIYYADIEITVGKPFLDQKRYQRSLYNLARFYYSNNDLRKSKTTYEIIIDSLPVNDITYKSYYQLGRVYNKLHDYYQAINYFEKALSVSDSMPKSSQYSIRYNYALVLENIETQNSLEKGLALLIKAEQISDEFNISLRRKSSLNSVLANFYSNDLIFNYKKAKSYYLNYLEFNKAQQDTFRLAATYNNLGILLNKNKNDSAFYYLKKGIDLTQTKGNLLAQLYFNLAEYYSIKNQPLKAIENTNFALDNLPSLTTDHTYKNKNAILTNDKALLWNILTDKAKYYLENYKITLDTGQAELALENLFIADQLIDDIRFESFESQSKLAWQNYASYTYMLGVKAAYILKDEGKAFYFMEKSKAILLLENISESQVKKQVNLPKSVLDKELHFEKTINTLENQIRNSNHTTDSLSKQYYNHKLQYKKFIESLKEDYPEYYNYKTPIQVISLNKAQENLSENDIIVEYILDEADGYILAISKDNSSLYEIKHTNDLKLKIEDYLAEISKPFSQQSDLDNFNSSSKELYKILLPFLEEDAFLNKKSITIIPDYLLQNTPFESLKTASNDYLLNSHEVNYGYSVSFLKHNENVKREAQKTFIGFSPNTFKNSKLIALHNSEFEILDANKRFSGSTYLNDLATKENFLSKSKDYKIIHLSTHADANDSIAPWIAFKNSKLYLNELYTTKNQAELVVLSACKSALGDLKKGEGVFSLARGFFYSGAHSVVSTLWNVNDKSTQEILSSFYNYLDQGKTKSAALRLAKLEYLDNNSHSEISPYYWSSLILVGDTSKIPTSSTYPIYLILFIVILTLFFFIKKRIA